jgi:tRNA pseudouridine38-40 synthase
MPRDLSDPDLYRDPRQIHPGEKNFKLVIEYDGGRYHGWQRQPEMQTLQETIENRISRMTGKPVLLTASGRTDAGVHALGQTANFHSDTRIAPEALKRGLNSLLPEDIVIHELVEVHPAFHARYDAQQKTYQYHVLNRPLPSAVGRQYQWHIVRPLDLPEMIRSAACLIGTHDFKSFEGTGSPRSHTIRTIYKALFEEKRGGEIIFTITANGFLRFMVRNIVGSLVEVGIGRWSAAQFEDVLISGDRRRAGNTAPAQGLFLVEVSY